MDTEPVPVEEMDLETLRDRLRVAERRLALADAQLAIARVAKVVPGPDPLPEAARDLGAALDVLFHTAAVAMVLLTADGTILRANRPAAELWGVPLAELPGRRTVEFTAAEDLDDTKARLGSGGPGQFLLKTYQRPDGTKVPALAFGWPLVDDDGGFVCMIGAAVPLDLIGTAPSLLERVLGAAGRAAKTPPSD